MFIFLFIQEGSFCSKKELISCVSTIPASVVSTIILFLTSTLSTTIILSLTIYYFTTLFFTGIIFVRESLPLIIYQDVVVCALSPKLLDRRDPNETKIKLVRFNLSASFLKTFTTDFFLLTCSVPCKFSFC